MLCYATLKQGLKFTDPLLVQLAANLAPSLLRIGGTDQNSYYYNMSEPTGYLPCDTSQKHARCVMSAGCVARD
jgi:hypothetical protein